MTLQPKRPPILRRSPARVCAYAIVACALIVVGAVLYVGMRLASPAHAAVGSAPPDLRAETVEIASRSGATLRGWFVAGRPGGGAVVLMHGLRSNRLSMLRRARLLQERGFSVLLFDFQAHGESPGRHITFGYLEALDARAAVEFVRRRLPAERVGVIGSSLGGAAALLGPAPLPVDALVLEAVYPDIGTALANRLHVALAPWSGQALVPLLVPLFKLLLPPIIGSPPGELRPIDRIGTVAAPVLIASGTRDNRTTMADTRELFERAREPKLLWAVQGAAHVDLEAYAPDEYRQRVLRFLDQLKSGDRYKPE